MKKKLNYLKKIKNLSFFFYKKNPWNNWALYLYDPFFLLFITYFIKKGNRKRSIRLIDDVLYLTKEMTRLSPIYVFKKAIFNSQVFLETIPVFKKKKRRGGKLKVIFYKSKMYNKRKRILKGIDLLMNHVRLIPTNELYLYEKIVASIINAFFKQGPVYHKLNDMFSCIGNINRKKRFYKQKNKILHYDVKQKKNRRMRNIRKGVSFSNRYKKGHKKKNYSIYGLCYNT